MGLLTKKPEKSKDTISRILEGTSVQPIEITQTKTKHKYMPWVTAQKELKFTFAPPADPEPPAYSLDAKEKPKVQVREISRDLEKGQDVQKEAEGMSLTQVAQVGALVSGALVGLSWAKRAYDTYYTAEKKS